MSEPRDLVLQALYELDAAPIASPLTSPEGLTGKAAAIFDGVVEHRAEIDAIIEGAASGWRLARMPIVDRNVLRIATFELLHRPDTPAGVVISEAVRLAKTFSTGRSAPFVNGVLATISKGQHGDDE